MSRWFPAQYPVSYAPFCISDCGPRWSSMPALVSWCPIFFSLPSMVAASCSRKASRSLNVYYWKKEYEFPRIKGSIQSPAPLIRGNHYLRFSDCHLSNHINPHVGHLPMNSRTPIHRRTKGTILDIVHQRYLKTSESQRIHVSPHSRWYCPCLYTSTIRRQFQKFFPSPDMEFLSATPFQSESVNGKLRPVLSF